MAVCGENVCHGVQCACVRQYLYAKPALGGICASPPAGRVVQHAELHALLWQAACSPLRQATMPPEGSVIRDEVPCCGRRLGKHEWQLGTRFGSKQQP